MGSRAGIARMCLVLASVVAAQSPPPESWKVRILEPGPGLELLPRAPPDGLISQLRWTPEGSEDPIVVTLARPVQSCAAAVTADGNGLVVLAGGIRDTLDLHLVDRRQPGARVIPTSGGRRLRESFNGGLGSWPLVEGPDLVLFAFEKEQRLVFWALDFERRIHDSCDDLPSEEVTGFLVDSDADSNEVRIRFLPGGEERSFPHPLAPRLDLGQGRLEFGSRVVGREVFRQVEVGNSGKRDLRVTLSTTGTEFRIVGSTDIVLEPGDERMVRVGFTPTRGGSFDGLLVLSANSPSPERRVTLRGKGLEPAAGESGGAPPALAAERAESGKAERVPEPDRPPGEPPAPPQVKVVKIDPLSPDRVAVTGVLEAGRGDAAAVELQAGAQTARAALGPGGGFRLELRASPGDVLWLSSVGRGQEVSPAVELGQVLPVVGRAGPSLEILTLPSQRYLLVVVAMDDEEKRVQRLWAAWEGRTNDRGVAEVDLDRIGPRRVPLHVLVYAGDRGDMRRSNLLRLEPDS